jgi:hypothetical protein
MGHFCVRRTLDVLHKHFFGQRWRESMLDTLHVGRPNLESYHMDYSLLCLYLVRHGLIYL